jgi:acetolactate synthase-1/2/3 large subunit
MQLIPLYEALALDLKNLGVECVFCLMSDDTAQLLASLDSAGVRVLTARHENNACAMAAGYAAATGRVGITVLGRGPSASNAIHGMTFAHRTGSPVLLIVGDTAMPAASPMTLGPDLKGFELAQAIRATGIPSCTASLAIGARQALAMAYEQARLGAYAYLLPHDVQMSQVDPQATQPKQISAPVASLRPARGAAISAAVHLLSQSRKPLIVAGQGARAPATRDALIALADHLGAAVATTIKAKDLFRGHPFDCGVVGSFSHGGGRRLIEQADCILAVGASLNERTTSYGNAFAPEASVIQIDHSRDKLGRWFHCDVAIAADAKSAAQQLLAALPARRPEDMDMRSASLREWLANYDLSRDFKDISSEQTLDPRRAGIELDRLLPQERNLVYDAGNFLSIAPYLSVPDPAFFKWTADFASIGMGFGAALGFACATPERTTVLVVGDGGFLMTMSELETTVREDLPLVIVLLNDGAYGAELHLLKMRGMPTALSQFPMVDFAPIADALGFRTATVRNIEQLRALKPLLTKPDGPILLDIKINGTVAAPFMSDGPKPPVPAT